MSGGCPRQSFGAHLSVAGGLDRAFDLAEAIGCDCLQVFVKNQRQWGAPPLRDEQIRAFREAQSRTGIRPVIAHASYLLNLASPALVGRRRTARCLLAELERCEALGIPFLVVHPGAHLGEGVDAGLRRVAAGLDAIHAATAGFTTRILLETTAGQGTHLGHEIPQLGRVMALARDPDRLGVCLDTCHLFAAGYDFRRPEGYARMLDELARSVGTGRVGCIHTNDSRGECGSRLDRHEHIGLGRMRAAPFRLLLSDPRLLHAPRILETPKGVDGRGRDWDRVNLQRLRRLATVRSAPTRSPPRGRDQR